MFDTEGMVFASTLVRYHTHRQTNAGHTGTNRLTNTCKNIMLSVIMCTQQLPVPL